VRRAAAAGLGAFNDNPAAMQLAAQLGASDPSPDVRAEALESLCYAHYNGMLDLVLSTYQQHVSSPAPAVRKAIAGRIGSMPVDPRVGPIVQALLADGSQEVRKRMAWYGVNMGEHTGLEPLFRRCAESDPDDDVRAEAVNGMRGFLEPKAAIAYARERLQRDPTEKMAWSALQIARSLDDERDAKALLTDVSKCQFADVASSARDALRG
jgi:HEAT repeat protein